MASKDYTRLVEHVADLRRDHGPLGMPPVDNFTVEAGRGETYHDGNPTLYAHGEHPRHSVLYGRESRVWVESFDSWGEAREAVAAAGIEKITEFWDDGGSSHVPVDTLTSHLSDGEDY